MLTRRSFLVWLSVLAGLRARLRAGSPAYVVAAPCVGRNMPACVESHKESEPPCVDVCPVDCIHPRADEPAYKTTKALYIHPDECIDCGACVPACPAEAIFASDEVPAKWRSYIKTNADYYRPKAKREPR